MRIVAKAEIIPWEGAVWGVRYTYQDGGWGDYQVGTREEAESQLYPVGTTVVDVDDKLGPGPPSRVS